MVQNADFSFLDHIPIGMFLLRRDYVVLHWNSCLEDWSGVSRADVLGRHIAGVFPHLTFTGYTDRLKRVFEGGPPVVFSPQLHQYFIPAFLPTGEYRAQYTTVTPFPADGENWHALVSIEDQSDVTHRLKSYQNLWQQAEMQSSRQKMAEELLRHRLSMEELLALISTRFVNVTAEELDGEIFGALQAVGEIVQADYVYFDWFTPDTRHVEHSYAWYSWVNAAALERQDHTPMPSPWLLNQLEHHHEVYIDYLSELPPAATSEKFRLATLSIESWLAIPLFFGKTLAGVCSLGSRQAAWKWLADDIRLLRLVGESLLNVLARRRWETELNLAKEAAEAANRAKSVFLANMSHELRTPLNAIMGFSDLMSRDAGFTTEQRRDLEIIHTSGQHLLALINDILDMAKIETGRVTLEEDTFDLPRLLRDLQELFSPQAAEKGLNLLFHRAPNLPRFVLADQHKLKQVLTNLLSNAVKFTQKGRVTLKARLQIPEPPSKNHRAGLRLDVKDNGPGIAPAEMNTLFEPFVQTAAGHKTIDGTGLGLAVCHRLVEFMGGSLSVESEPGQGSLFSLLIPVGLVAQAVVPEQPPDAADPPPAKPERPVNLAAALAILPPDWLAAMEQAVIEANLSTIQEIITQIKPVDAPAAATLQDLTQNFDYDTILAVIEQARKLC
jgi:signal transduction histidine kinase